MNLKNVSQALGALLLLAGTCNAQLQVSLHCDRTRYVAGESTVATVTVENRAGKDVVLGGPEGRTWLQMDVMHLKGGSGERVNPAGEEPQPTTVLLPKDGKIIRKIDLQAYYPIKDAGQYLASCSVYFAELDRWLTPSKKAAFEIGSPRSAFWEESIGLPAGHKSGEGYRKYRLFTFKSAFREGEAMQNHELIYFQIKDEKTDMSLGLGPISQILNYYDPQPAVDGEGNLHVLYMQAPSIYAHAVVEPDGNIKDIKQYENAGSDRPKLMRSNLGKVVIRGGAPYDPVAAAKAKEEARKTTPNLSDRPAGLPK